MDDKLAILEQERDAWKYTARKYEKRYNSMRHLAMFNATIASIVSILGRR